MQNHDLSHFFSVLKEKKKSYQENYKYFAPRLAPKFNIFNFVRRDENALSYVISNLLDPNGDHEQGEVFLKLFTELLSSNLKLQEGDIKQKYDDYENAIKDIIKQTKLEQISNSLQSARCATESTTSQIANNQRRIDLVIDFGDFGIGIENKPWAFDQKDQLQDYALELEARYPRNKSKDFILVYLTGGRWDVTKETISKEHLDKLILGNRFLQITYTDIKNWLIKCEAICQADRVKNFLRDFIEYCEKQFEGKIDMLEKNLILEYVCSSAQNIELAFDIANIFPKIKEGSYLKLKLQIEEIFKLKSQENSEHWIIETSAKYPNDKQIIFKKEGWENFFISIREEYGWFYGIRSSNEKQYLSNEHISIFERSLTGKFEKYKQGWFNSFRIYFREPYKFWDSNSNELAKVISGKSGLPETIYNAVIEIDKVISENEIPM